MKAPPASVEQKILMLQAAPLAVLRQEWRSTYASDPPVAFGPDLLRRSLAYSFQEKALGRLGRAVRRKIDRAIRFVENSDETTAAKSCAKNGTVLTRTWNDKNYQVYVLHGGFSFAGKTYSSLSEIAREITGTRWNGPRFFGLRNSKRKTKSAASEARHV